MTVFKRVAEEHTFHSLLISKELWKHGICSWPLAPCLTKYITLYNGSWCKNINSIFKQRYQVPLKSNKAKKVGRRSGGDLFTSASTEAKFTQEIPDPCPFFSPLCLQRVSIPVSMDWFLQFFIRWYSVLEQSVSSTTKLQYCSLLEIKGHKNRNCTLSVGMKRLTVYAYCLQ